MSKGGGCKRVADLIRAIESDLFGSYEWSADLYEDLRAVPEAADRLAVWRGLLRAYEALEGRADDAMKAAEAMVAAEAELPHEVSQRLAALDAARDALLESAGPEAARAFVDAFDAAWADARARETMVADAILAALARSNVLASRQAGDPRALHRESAALYEQLSAMLHKRVEAGALLWKETAASAVNRRVVALRLAGDDESARRLAEAMGAGEFMDASAYRSRTKPGAP